MEAPGRGNWGNDSKVVVGSQGNLPRFARFAVPPLWQGAATPMGAVEEGTQTSASRCSSSSPMRHSQEQGTDLAVRAPDRATACREGVRKHGVMTRLLLALWASLVSVELTRGSATREPRKGWTGLEGAGMGVGSSLRCPPTNAHS